MWFETLVGFREEFPELICKNLSVDGEILTSAVNGKSYRCGTLETSLLGELRERVANRVVPSGMRHPCLICLKWPLQV
ncbi:MAG: hypothetical protein EOL87_04375 [Spartobacteria bacterium]|nr:hypothetical protein [Spartobacteria bacterium]